MAACAGGCGPLTATVGLPPLNMPGADDSLMTDLCPDGFCAAAGAMVGNAGLAGEGELLKLNNFFIPLFRIYKA